MDQRKVIHDLLSYAERQICTHEETYRGGVIWEICRSCGKKWADDEGGRPEFEWPKAIVQAREILDSPEPRPQPDNKEGEGVEWEPMESAPKNGSDVIGFEHGQGLHITWWDATHDLGRGGWRMAHHGWRPTHWMRLPDPPEKSHRDKVIEAAYDATDKRELGCCEWQEHARRIFEQLYKADLLKLPGDEQ